MVSPAHERQLLAMHATPTHPHSDIFGKYGAIRQVRIGSGKETRGTAYVIYEDIYDAKVRILL